MDSKPPRRPHLSIVVPAYNEERRLPATLQRIAAYVDRSGLTAEFVVVDDGSTDGTARLALEFLRGRPGRLVRNPGNRGKGFSVRQGLLQAEGRWILLTDADLSTPIEEHARLAEAAREFDLDAAIGSRAMRESRVEIRQSLLRQAMGKTFNRIIRFATGLPHRDTQCGFKLIDRDRALPLFRRMVVDRFAFDVEFLFLCHRFGLKVREVPVLWRNAPGSKVSLVGDPMNMLFDVLRVRWYFRRGLYNPEGAGEAAKPGTGG